jgi:hypothetical protein
VIFRLKYIQERGRGLGFLVSSFKHRMLVKSVLRHTKPITPKCLVSFSIIIKSCTYSRKHRGFWVKSNLNYAVNLLTKLAKLNNTHKGFFIKT